MKKLVFTVTNDLNYDQRMQRICGSLANAGYDVLLVGRKLKTSLPLSKKNYDQQRNKNKNKDLMRSHYPFFKFRQKYHSRRKCLNYIGLGALKGYL